MVDFVSRVCAATTDQSATLMILMIIIVLIDLRFSRDAQFLHDFNYPVLLYVRGFTFVSLCNGPSKPRVDLSFECLSIGPR
jgi:hypothetical protein